MNIRKRIQEKREPELFKDSNAKKAKEKKKGGGGVVVFGSVASCWLLLKSFVHDVYIYTVNIGPYIRPYTSNYRRLTTDEQLERGPL